MSKLDQIHSRPATVIMTTRADLRYVATLANFWHKQNECPKSISELIRLSLESFAEFLISSNRTQFVQTHSDAQEIMDRLGMTVKKINPRHLGAALSREDSAFDSVLTTPAIDHSHQVRTRATPISKEDPTLAAARAKLEAALDGDLEARIKDSITRSKDFRDNLLPKGDI